MICQKGSNLFNVAIYIRLSREDVYKRQVVLPDKYVQGLEVSENHLIIDTKEDTDAELENKIKEDMQHQLVKAVSYTHLDVYKRQDTPSL